MLGTEALGGHQWGNLDIADVEKAVLHAADVGIGAFDTADCYGLGLAEERLGKLLAGRRNSAFIATKFGVRHENGKTWHDNAPAYIEQALHASLRRLGTSHIDLYQLHWPDQVTPLDAVFERLERFCEAGLIRSYGVCNLPPSMPFPVNNRSARFASFSLEYSLAQPAREAEIKSILAATDLGFLSWGTLGQGVLSGKYSAPATFPANDRRALPHWKNFHGATFEHNMKLVAALQQIAARLETPGISPAVLAIRWNMQRLPRCLPIVGVKSPAQVDDVKKALTLQLPEWAMAQLGQLAF
ncbi:MAG: aldo/keto reductase [Alphaproteobacteria bacterium]|nr:aldo/keto reductase [Alphaproteobacteria bacterium]